jgi:hypothetical protein
VLLPADHEDSFVQVPFVAGRQLAAANAIGEFSVSWRKHTKQQNQLVRIDVSFAIT